MLSLNATCKCLGTLLFLGSCALSLSTSMAGESFSLPGSPIAVTGIPRRPWLRGADPSAAGHLGTHLPPNRSVGILFGKRSLLFLGGLGTAAAISKHHEDPESMAHTIDRSGLDLLVDFGNEFGDGLPLGITAAGLLVSGRLAGNEGLSSAGGDMIRSLLWSGMIVWSLKVTVNAERPDGGHYSFPSGHTASAFSVAPVVAEHWGWRAGVGSFVLATSTALGRMEDRRHYLADVLFGAAIGLAVGYEVAKDDNNGILGGLRRLMGPFSISPQGLELSMSF